MQYLSSCKSLCWFSMKLTWILKEMNISHCFSCICNNNDNDFLGHKPTQPLVHYAVQNCSVPNTNWGEFKIRIALERFYFLVGSLSVLLKG